MDVLWPDIPVWEIVIRSASVFLFLIILIRITGKRDVGEMSPADLILLLLLSANVHTSLSGSDESILGGMIGAATLIALNYGMNAVAYRNRSFENLLKGKPEVVICRGDVHRDVLKRHHLTEMQLGIALRKEGVEDPAEVKMAILEPDGTITVIKHADSSVG